MREHRKKYAAIMAVCIFLMAFIPYLTIVRSNGENKTSASDSEGGISTLNLETAMEDGVFTVLEIVPYRGMGTLGYFAGGSEIVPADYTITREDMFKHLVENEAEEKERVEKNKIRKPYRIIEQKYLSSGDNPSDWYITNEFKISNGYFKLINTNDATYATTPKYILKVDGEVVNRTQLKAILDIDKETEESDQSNTSEIKDSNTIDKTINKVNPDVEDTNPESIDDTISSQDNIEKEDSEGVETDNNTEKSNKKSDTKKTIEIDQNSDKSDKEASDELGGEIAVESSMISDKKDPEEETTELPKEENKNITLVDDSKAETQVKTDEESVDSIDKTDSKTKRTLAKSSESIDFEFIQDDINGNYIWVDSNVKGEEFDLSSDQIWLYNYNLSKNTYKRLINNEIFKREVLNINENDLDSINVEILTLEPHEVTVDDMKNADFVQIRANIFNATIIGQYMGLYEDYNEQVLNIKDQVKYAGYTANYDNILNFYKRYTELGNPNSLVCNDIEWDVIVKLMERLALDKIPLVIDKEIGNANNVAEEFRIDFIKPLYNSKGELYGTGNSNNVFKLYAMLQYKPEFFYDLYIKPASGEPALTASVDSSMICDITGEERKTGLFTHSKMQDIGAETGTIYWIYGTLLPAKWKYGTGDNWKEWTDIGIICQDDRANGVYENVVVDNSNWAFDKEFTSEKGNGWLDGMKDVKDYLGPNGDSVSTSELFDYLINGVKRKEYIKKDLKILQLQPSATYKSTAYLDNIIKTAVPTYRGTISVTNMTTSEFIGKQEDINSIYDMIYIGTEIGNLPTNYKDTALNQKIYLHVGDKVIGGTSFNHNASMGESSYRYSGNDITKEKMSQLNEFLSAGLPILTEPDLYGLNKTKIDDSSYINKFFDDNKTTKNLINVSNLDLASKKEDLLNGINIVKPKLTLISSTLHYVQDREEASSYEQRVINSSTIKKIDLVFKFTGDSSDNYKLYYYYDKTNDGIIQESDKVDHIDNLKPNEEIRLSLPILNPSKPGIVQWKVKLVNQSNESIRDQITDYTKVAYKNPTTGNYREDKQLIKVLEIHSNGARYNMTEHYNNTGSSFYKYIQEVKDYKFQFESISIDQFNRNKNSKDKTVEWNVSELKKYDIVALSFKDSVDYISLSSGRVTLLQNYVDASGSLIYFHDSISHNNQLSMADNPYYLNQNFRNRFAINRFNIGTNETDYSGSSHTKDSATSPSNGSTAGNQYNQLHGYTYTELMQYAGNSNQLAPFKNLQMNTSPSTFASGYTTNKIKKVNDGQITNYPFEIGNDITVEETHAQAYQLDIDDPNLVVWYCLSDNQDGIGSSAWYSTSPKDVRNNYYLYSKGNVIYSGVGHRDKASTDETKLLINTLVAALLKPQNHMEEEMEIPDIIIKNAEKVTDEYYYYLDFDDINQNASLETAKIIFQIGEDEAYSSGSWKAKFYFNQLNKNTDSYGKAYNTDNVVEGTDIQVYKNSDDSIVSDNEVTTGIEYYIKCPVDKVKNNGKLPVDIILTDGTQTIEDPLAKQRVTLLYRPFFHLD